MPKINLHIIAIVLVVGLLFSFNWKYGSETFILFGFAENKEMEIRLEHPVSVQKIYATSGTKVEKGDLLFEVTRSQLELSSNDLDYEVARLGSELSAWKSGLRATIAGLEAQKSFKESEIKSQIAQLESEKSLNESLIKDIKSIQSYTKKSKESPIEIKLKGLRRELVLSVKPIENEIRKLKAQLSTSNNPLNIQIQKLNNKRSFVDTEKEALQVFAIDRGIVGEINCKVGEQFPAYNTLMTFYQENPTLVKGYVMESLLLKVKEGDELEIQSTHQSTSFCLGKVVGLGSRIVEIPERLRKMPEFKTYGREIILEIPANNNFLQNEKVVMRLPNENTNLLDVVINIFKTESPVFSNLENNPNEN